MNKATRIAMDITADYQYVYDPEHQSKPSGNWKMTGSGWSKNDVVEEPHRSVVKQAPAQERKPEKTEAPKPSEEKPEKEYEAPSKVEEVEKPASKHTEENPEKEESLFDENGGDDEFVTDEKGKSEEKQEKSEKLDFDFDDDDSDEGKSDEDEDDDGFSLDDEETEGDKEGNPEGSEDSEDDGKSDDDSVDDGEWEDDGESDEDSKDSDDDKDEDVGGDEEEDGEDSDEDLGVFDDSNKEQYVDPDKYDEYIEKMNSFIEKFDDGEGKENDVTFKAIASNLDWSSAKDVKAFSEHCAKKELEGADDILAFLYFLHAEDEEKFDKVVEDMK